MTSVKPIVYQEFVHMVKLYGSYFGISGFAGI
jgi:hypothetical protein